MMIPKKKLFSNQKKKIKKIFHLILEEKPILTQNPNLLNLKIMFSKPNSLPLISHPIKPKKKLFMSENLFHPKELLAPIKNLILPEND